MQCNCCNEKSLISTIVQKDALKDVSISLYSVLVETSKIFNDPHPKSKKEEENFKKWTLVSQLLPRLHWKVTGYHPEGCIETCWCVHKFIFCFGRDLKDFQWPPTSAPPKIQKRKKNRKNGHFFFIFAKIGWKSHSTSVRRMHWNFLMCPTSVYSVLVETSKIYNEQN